MNKTTKNFEWKVLLLTQLPCGGLLFIAAYCLDNFLFSLGVDIHPWREAMFAAIGGMFFSSIFIPVLWRLGLITVQQYLIGAIALFVPCTLITLVILGQFQSIKLPMVSLIENGSVERIWAMSIYIRIARSAILFPIYIFFFWLIYHKLLGYKHL